MTDNDTKRIKAWDDNKFVFEVKRGRKRWKNI